jgi:predicted PurR-regulated permease PerM
MTVFLLFFLLRDGEAMARAAGELIPIEPGERDTLIRSLGTMIVAIFRGSFLCALAQGASGGIGWWIAGLGSPALAGAAMSFLSLLPLGGTALVWIPGCAWAWYSGHPGSALFLFIWGMVVTSFLADNVLRPILIGRAEDLSTLVVFLGVFGGIAAFGLLGVFLGPILLALAMLLVDVLRRHASTERAPTPA